MDLRVTGGRELAALSRRLDAAGSQGKGLKRALDRAARVAVGDLGKAVTTREATDPYTPRGYEAVFNAGLDWRAEVLQSRDHRVALVVWSDGRKNRRKITAINAGTLRHPVFGRARRVKGRKLRQRNPWVAQPIRPGVITEPALKQVGAVAQTFREAMHDVAKKI